MCLGGIKDNLGVSTGDEPLFPSQDIRRMSFSTRNSAFPSAAFEEALAVALADGAFNDTVYYLFSRHTASGKVGSPRAVYANSSVMKAAAEHFRARKYSCVVVSYHR